MIRKTPYWKYAEENNYPLGTTAADLAACRSRGGNSALHTAAAYGHLPIGTTIEDLVRCKDNQGRSALITAAEYNHLLPNTTAAQLAAVKDRKGHSALHAAAKCAALPAGTTKDDLLAPKDKLGRTPWDLLMHCVQQNPALAVLHCPPSVFQTDHQLAWKIATRIQKDLPKLHSKTTIWLGNILAASTTQTPPT